MAATMLTGRIETFAKSAFGQTCTQIGDSQCLWGFRICSSTRLMIYIRGCLRSCITMILLNEYEDTPAREKHNGISFLTLVNAR